MPATTLTLESVYHKKTLQAVCWFHYFTDEEAALGEVAWVSNLAAQLVNSIAGIQISYLAYNWLL